MRDFAPTHPGELLLTEFLEPLSITQLKLAEDLGLPYARINELVKGKRGITAETALLLSRYFDMSAEFWLNAQAHFDLAIARERSREKIERVRPLAKAVQKSSEISC